MVCRVLTWIINFEINFLKREYVSLAYYVDRHSCQKSKSYIN
jgi:hypothetical protein